MKSGIIGEVAALAPRTQILGIAVSGVMVQVGGGQNNLAPRNRVRMSVLSPAIRVRGRSLATPARAILDLLADLFPVGGVEAAVKWHDVDPWYFHGSLTFALPCSGIFV